MKDFYLHSAIGVGTARAARIGATEVDACSVRTAFEIRFALVCASLRAKVINK